MDLPNKDLGSFYHHVLGYFNDPHPTPHSPKKVGFVLQGTVCVKWSNLHMQLRVACGGLGID